VRQRHPEAFAPQNRPTRIIIAKLEQFLRRTRVRRVYFAEDTVAPPTLAYVTHFPRLYVPLSGCHSMDVAQSGVIRRLHPTRGHAVFVPDNAWDKPAWSSATQVLTFLFGAKHIGISLVEHRGGAEAPMKAIKTNIHGAYDGLTHSILGALRLFAGEPSKGPLARLLTESLLHSCLRLLTTTSPPHLRKAARTYESICLYVQENFQIALNREKVASHFALAPNHVSRLFSQEGQMGFNDYLNSVRIHRAKFMLRNYSMTLKEVAANCGYSEVAYFCRLFKKINKETPTEYRATENGSSR
jgi:AraC-like DNA-binding protein